MIERRRSSDFIERLSYVLVMGAYLGGFIVLLDIKFLFTLGEQMVEVGGSGFSAEVKGVVLQSMLITGFAAVVAFWLGTTKQGQDQAQSVNKIAEAAAPTTALAVAAARTDPPPPVIVMPNAVTPAPANPVTGVIPAAEVAQPTKGNAP